MKDKKEETLEGSEKKKEEGKKFAPTRRPKWEKPSGGSKPSMRPGELPVFAACALLFLLSLAYLVKYFSEGGEFNLLGISIILLMLSPGLPFIATLKARKNPGLYSINYGYAGFLWLMQLGEVSLMKGIWTYAASGFFVGLDFWVLAAATGIALGTCPLRLRRRLCDRLLRHGTRRLQP